jgi:hypothetical protein
MTIFSRRQQAEKPQVRDVNMWSRFTVGHTTRTLALALCLGVVLGGSLPELGNLTAYFLWGSSAKSHFFNDYFMVAGILGIVICGIALRRRLLQPRVVKK